MDKLEEIAAAMEKTAKEAGVHIVSGDTKVAGKGQVDGIFITTTGMGEIEEGVTVGGELAKPGDAIIVTGDIGRHGCTILLEREDFGIDADVTSDCAPLWKTVKAVMDTTHNLHVIRDATSRSEQRRHPFKCRGCSGTAGSKRSLRDAWT